MKNSSTIFVGLAASMFYSFAFASESRAGFIASCYNNDFDPHYHVSVGDNWKDARITYITSDFTIGWDESIPCKTMNNGSLVCDVTKEKGTSVTFERNADGEMTLTVVSNSVVWNNSYQCQKGPE